VSYLVRAVAAPALAAGFRLGGVAVDEVTSPGQVADVLGRLAAAGDVGVILVQQDFFDALDDTVRRDFERRPLPIIVPVPAAEWATRRPGAEDYILELLRRAIGYRVRLQ
jgi:vacuolar-type H+-ATPase subunit F/Vma7